MAAMVGFLKSVQRGFVGWMAVVALVCFAGMLVMWFVVSERVGYEERNDAANAEHLTQNLAIALEQQTIRQIQSIDQLVLFVRHEYQEEGARLDLRGLLSYTVLDADALVFVAIVDEQGILRFSSRAASGLDLSDRDYYREHAARAADRLFIGRPTPARTDGRPVINFSRRISGPAGEFRGVAVAGVAADHLAQGARHFDIGQRGQLILLGDDGIARARRIGQALRTDVDMSDSTLLARARQGDAASFVSRGRTDGVPRFMSYRKVAGYPLVAAVGVPVDEALAGAQARRRIYYAGAAAGTLIALLLTAGLLAALWRQKRALDSRRRAEERYRATFDEAPVGIAHADLGGRFLRVNRKLCDMLGYSEDELLCRSWPDVTREDDVRRTRTLLAGLSAGTAPALPVLEKRYVAKDGTELWANATLTIVRQGNGQPDYVITMLQDITERRAAEEAIREAEARFRATFEQSAVGVAHGTLDGTYLRVNRKFASMLGYRPEELVGASVEHLTHAEDRGASEEAKAWLRVHPEDSLVPEYEKRYLRKDGGALWASVSLSVVRDAAGVPEYLIAMVKDISARKQAEEKLVHQAHYDALTELPNRTLLYDRLAQTLNQARRHDWTVGVVTLDLDRFNAINETLGHRGGDRLLAEVAKRLALCVRGGDTVARVGGDEFALIAAELSHAQDAALVAAKVMQALALPFEVDGEEVFVSASAGIATFPIDGRDGTALMKNADAAMFRAKELGRNNFQFYTAAMNERAADKLHLETELRRALERSEFRLHFQPKASLASGAISGFEALLRWQRPGKELVSPAQFVPVLEETGLIVPVGDWVIRGACAQVGEWRRAGLVPLPIAVNLSAKQFAHRDIVAVVDAALEEYDVPAALLELEITESDAMHTPEATMSMLRRLKERGVDIAIDDFGTGYSSLSYLKRYPVNTVKLDRSFVQGLPEDGDDVSIARAVITMAHSLGLAVVAEGVETVAQRQFLAAAGCDQMQGYLLSRPVPAAHCTQWLVAEAPAVAA